jgi:hypothetical protein
MLLTSSSDGIEASVLKRPYTPPPETIASAPKRGRPKKAPSRFEIGDDSAHFFDESETWGLPPQSELFTPHYLDPSPSATAPHASTSSASMPNSGVDGGMDDFVSNQVQLNFY